MKALIVNGSIRRNGNTDILIRHIIAGASDGSVEITVHALRDLQIGQCIGCYRCRNASTCSQNDDMTALRGDLSSSDVLVFASPLYWGGVTGLMKTFIDRMFFYYHPTTRSAIAGKRAVVITTMNQTNVEYECQPLVEFYHRLFRCIGIDAIQMHAFGGLMEKGTVSERNDYLEQANRIGEGLAE